MKSFLRIVGIVVASVVVLVLAGAAAFYGYVQFNSWHRAKTRRASPDSVENSNDPSVLLKEAIRLYWLNNGPKAAPLFTKAEKLYADRGDTRNQIYAGIGRVRSEAETMSFVDVSRFLGEQLEKPIVQNDLELKSFCLAAKGYTDIEIDYQASKRDWLEAQKIAEGIGDRQLKTRASGELGLIAFLEGNPGHAAQLLGGALLSTMANGDTGGEVRFLELLGNGFEEVNRHSEALKFFERAIRIAEANQDSGLPFMGYEGKAQALSALGRADEAKRVLEDALAKARSKGKRGHEAQLLILLGKLTERRGDKQQAVSYLEDAGQFAAGVRFYRMEADAMFELAALYRDQGDLATAEARATQGLTASQKVGDRYYVPRNLTILADLKSRQGHTAEATALYEHAEDVIDSMLLAVNEPYWNSSFAASLSQTYLQHFELAARKKDTSTAFGVLERVRGRTIASVLEDRNAVPKSESRDTTALEAEVASVQAKLMQTEKPTEREQLLDILVEDERRLGLAWTADDSRRRKFLVKPVALAKLRQDLKPDELLLEYVLDEPNSLCLSISRQSARVQQLPAGREQIESLVQKFSDEIRSKSSALEASKQLYALLLKPVAEIATATRIIIVPDGLLHLVPFDTLRDSDGQFLLRSHVISYVPSGTILDVFRDTATRAVARRPFLGVGDVAYENQGGVGRKLGTPHTLHGRIERGLANLSGIRLHDLPQTREEVEAIGRIVGKDAEILLSAKATESGFKREPLRDFRVLHLAVHGFADTQYPERSALVLGADPASSEDGLLQVREIIRLTLNAELTTLSACDSGVGKLQGQEGITNLVEAFLLAGSKSVVASLWSADDTFASALMERFYQHLAEGKDKSSALRDAKLDLLNQYGEQVSPFYWGAFVIAGDGSTPVELREP